jgi:hypothetical protein
MGIVKNVSKIVVERFGTGSGKNKIIESYKSQNKIGE